MTEVNIKREIDSRAIDVIILFRQYIRDENDIANHRMNWFVNLTAFLVTSFTLLIVSKYEYKYFIAGGICVMGALIGSSTSYSVAAAYRTLNRTREVWKLHYEPDFNKSDGNKNFVPFIPYMTGGGPGSGLGKVGIFLARFTPAIFTAIWLVGFIFCVYNIQFPKSLSVIDLLRAHYKILN